MLYQTCLLIALTLSLFSRPSQALEYTIHDVGTLPYENSAVAQINNHHVVTGVVKTEKGLQAYVWS